MLIYYKYRKCTCAHKLTNCNRSYVILAEEGCLKDHRNVANAEFWLTYRLKISSLKSKVSVNKFDYKTELLPNFLAYMITLHQTAVLANGDVHVYLLLWKPNTLQHSSFFRRERY